MRKLWMALVICCGCENDPISVQSTNNSNIAVEVLFQHDGCTVYRFDDGNPHYYVRCPHSESVSVMDEHTESCGKNCVRTVPDVIQTNP